MKSFRVCYESPVSGHFAWSPVPNQHVAVVPKLRRFASSTSQNTKYQTEVPFIHRMAVYKVIIFQFLSAGFKLSGIIEDPSPTSDLPKNPVVANSGVEMMRLPPSGNQV